jgi:quinol monooxygenase YgiN
MSGRRRRGDGWDDGHLDARDERRDPWADSADEWGNRDHGSADADGWSDASGGGRGTGGYPAGGATRAYAAGDATGKGYSPASPSYSSSQGAGANGRGPSAGGQTGGYEAARNGADRYGAGPAYGGQRGRGAANGQGSAGYDANGYQDSGYGRAGNGGSRRDAAGYDPAQGGRRNGPADGRNGYGYGGGRPSASAFAPEFTPADNTDMDEDGPAGTPRPYGRLSIYTLHEDKEREFDRLAERAAEGVRAAEPDTLVYVIHVVPKAPMQRIIYEIYRDRAAFLTHERQPHIRQFAADRASCVLATNIIDLRLKYAKVAALGSAADSPVPPRANQAPRMPEPAAGNDHYQAASGQYPTAQQSAQYSATQYSPAQQPGAANFTSAKEQYSDVGQPTVGREAFRTAAQYGSGGYGVPNGQYGAANVQSGAAGYANDGGYSSASSYQSPNGYSAGNGYGGAAGGGYSAPANGYQGANSYAEASGAAYASGNGYSAANGYSNGGSYQNGHGYANGDGYSAANGYSNGGSYQDANGYGAVPGYGSNGASPPTPQYTPRYRELTSGGTPDDGAGGYPDSDGRYADGGQTYRPQQSERAPRPQGQR